MSNKEIKIDGTITYATFIDRPNRFLVNLIPEGHSKIERAFLHDPGRMKELLKPNARLLIRKPKDLTNRKTNWDILAVEFQGLLVIINSSLPNKVIRNALINKWITELVNFNLVKTEITYGKSRLDFLLEKNKQKCFVEVKGVTLVKNNTALFPDAPTSRGTRHIHELIDIIKKGHKGILFFVCMREDPVFFAPNKETDPAFSEALYYGMKNGVEILSYKVKPLIRNNQLIIQFKDKIKLNL